MGAQMMEGKGKELIKWQETEHVAMCVNAKCKLNQMVLYQNKDFAEAAEVAKPISTGPVGSSLHWARIGLRLRTSAKKNRCEQKSAASNLDLQTWIQESRKLRLPTWMRTSPVNSHIEVESRIIGWWALGKLGNLDTSFLAWGSVRTRKLGTKFRSFEPSIRDSTSTFELVGLVFRNFSIRT